MKANYATLDNGSTIIIKADYRLGDQLYFHYWFKNSWIPTSININKIARMRPIKLHEPTMTPYDDSAQKAFFAKMTDGFTNIPNTYRVGTNGGNELFTNNPSGIRPMLLKSTGTAPNTGTVVYPVFPKIEPNWFYTGFPAKLTVGGAKGNLVEFVPIFFYAKRDGNEKFTLPKLPDRIGYLDNNNVFTETLVWDGPFKKGGLMFTLLLDKNSPVCAGSKLNDTSYWNLMTEFSNIDPGSTATKAITITSGITKTQGFSMGLSIGSRIGVEVGIEGIAKVTAELSVQLSTSFSTEVAISQQISTTDTVEFKAQDRTQRISTYQFIEQYNIDAAAPLKQKVDSLNDKNKNYVANFAEGKFQPAPFNYGSRYFAKAFVLEPTM
ncbi:hypothetical protein C3495_08925 [Clostridiaceae bacterium 14S0207]|nr:hypothetical protein C3495_08925 [Clostridiaceae bacterium 14S0207]